jgi:hypothetical protein
MKTALVYHWWADPLDRIPQENLRVPIIQSIATFRQVDKETPIYILNSSINRQDWRNLALDYDFKIIDITPTLQRYEDKPGWQHLSRLFDLEKIDIEEDVIVYSDSDIFWFEPLLPLAKDSNKFCFNGTNSGFFYYNKKSPIVEKFFELFKAYTITALNDDNFRVIQRQFSEYLGWYYVLDETILQYMFVKHSNLFDKLDYTEHMTCNLLKENSKFKMFHTHGMEITNELTQHRYSRGLFPLQIRELFEGVKLLYDQELLNHYLPKQQSIKHLAYQLNREPLL